MARKKDAAQGAKGKQTAPVAKKGTKTAPKVKKTIAKKSARVPKKTTANQKNPPPIKRNTGKPPKPQIVPL